MARRAFRVRLADVQTAVDRFFVAGVNHVVYHGTAYSPVGEPWPGWQFYASVEFNPQNAWWDDFGALNAYVARVQSFLQSGQPDNDVLLYYPFYESLAVRGTSLLAHFGGAAPPARGTTFEKAAARLQAAASPTTSSPIGSCVARGLQPAGSHRGRRVIRRDRAAVVALHSARNLEQVLALARAGATVVSLKGWPSDVSGLADLDARRAQFQGGARRGALRPGRCGRDPRSGNRPRPHAPGQ